jgi:predicted ester cyclase
MSSTTNKQIVRRLFEEAFNHDRGELVDELIAAEYVDAAGERGPGAFKQVMTRLRTACPDIQYTIEDVLGEGDEVAIRWHWSGTHRGIFRGITPTGRAITNNGIAIFRLQAGKIVAAALETDRLGFLQAIGLVPSTEALFPAPAQGTNAVPAS